MMLFFFGPHIPVGWSKRDDGGIMRQPKKNPIERRNEFDRPVEPARHWKRREEIRFLFKIKIGKTSRTVPFRWRRPLEFPLTRRLRPPLMCVSVCIFFASFFSFYWLRFTDSVSWSAFSSSCRHCFSFSRRFFFVCVFFLPESNVDRTAAFGFYFILLFFRFNIRDYIENYFRPTVCCFTDFTSLAKAKLANALALVRFPFRFIAGQVVRGFSREFGFCFLGFFISFSYTVLRWQCGSRPTFREFFCGAARWLDFAIDSFFWRSGGGLFYGVRLQSRRMGYYI